MINIVLSKKLIPDIGSTTLYKDLTELRTLRNKIHIHNVKSSWDTDWNSFGKKEIKLTKKILYGLLSSNLFQPEDTDNKLFSFLKD